MIEVRSISKFYGNKRAVEDLSFTIQDGEIVGLLGLNGAGKSTILKILGCFLLPSQGDAKVGQFSVSDQADEVRRLIGYLPDTPPLYNEMKTRDYLAFVARLKNLPKAEVPSQVEEVIERCNLTEVATTRLGELSHGFRQRVGIAQALVHKPKILILDEPINGLDPIQIVEMRDMILSLKGKHTVILSSHILSEITKTCDRILVIDRGRLVAEGSESKLRGEGQLSFEVRIELAKVGAETLNRVKQLPSVQSVTLQEQSGLLMDVQCQSDIRPELAEAIVQSGGRLLSLTKREAELETLFLKLIQPEGVGHE